jgi:hypothetical protein
MPRSAREIYWSAIIADFRRSGLTHVQFCRLRKISIHSFRSWLYRRPPAAPPAKTDRPSLPAVPLFLPVHVRPEPASVPTERYADTSPPPLELVVGCGRRLRIPVGFDPTTLGQLLDLLETRP